MDILPSGNIFRELQDIYDTGYFSSQVSIEDQWQQASEISGIFVKRIYSQSHHTPTLYAKQGWVKIKKVETRNDSEENFSTFNLN